MTQAEPPEPVGDATSRPAAGTGNGSGPKRRRTENTAKVVQLYMNEETYEALRLQAFLDHTNMSAWVMRQISPLLNKAREILLSQEPGDTEEQEPQ